MVSNPNLSGLEEAAHRPLQHRLVNAQVLTAVLLRKSRWDVRADIATWGNPNIRVTSRHKDQLSGNLVAISRSKRP